MFPELSRPIRRVFATVVALLLVLIAAGLPSAALADTSTPPQGSADQITFGVQPASAKGPDGRPFFVWGATPGATLTDDVAVVNYSNQPVKLSLYATDALNTDEGGFGLLPTSDRPTDAGSWVHLAGVGNKVNIPSRTASGPGTVVVPMQVTIPQNATPGDHAGGVVAVLTSIDPNSQGTKVRLEQRVGSRIFVRVSGDITPALTVENLSASYHGTLNPVGRGSATVNYTLKNTGNVNLGAKSDVTVSGLFGDSAATAPEIPLLLPGGSVNVSVRVPNVLPQVWMHATVDVKAVATSSGPVDNPPTASAQASFSAIPWTLLALVLLVIVLTGGYVWRRRRRASPGPRHRRVSPEVRQPEGATP